MHVWINQTRLHEHIHMRALWCVLSTYCTSHHAL